MGERVLGTVLGMGLQGGRRAGGMDGLCRIFAHTHSARLAWAAQRLFCVIGFCFGDIHLAGREFSPTGPTLICRRLIESTTGYEKEKASICSPFLFPARENIVESDNVTYKYAFFSFLSSYCLPPIINCSFAHRTLKIVLTGYLLLA